MSISGRTAVWSVLALMVPSSAAAEIGTARLAVHPSSIVLEGPRDRARILVSMESPDGFSRDGTDEAVFTSLDERLVIVSPSGECQGRQDGQTSIRVTCSGSTAVVRVSVHIAQRQAAPSFVNEVTPLLTRLGCNQGSCHGKGAGQNGFKLSLRGHAPEADYLAITRDGGGRRVSPVAPAQSLFLRKPLGLERHDGGLVLRPGGREHDTLLSWLLAGMPGPRADETAVTRLEILPGSRCLRVGQEQQLLVRAEYGTGASRDVTWLCQFESNNAAVATVDSQGKVRMASAGEGAVSASFLGSVATVVFTAPHERVVRGELLAQRHNFIDDHVFNKLAQLRIEPAELCDDAAFLRRAFLDTIGLLPTPDEVSGFLADTRGDKRARLIDALLERPEFVDFWAQRLADVLQNRSDYGSGSRGAKGVRSFHAWLRRQLAEKRGWDHIARQVLTASGKVTDHPPVGYFLATMEGREKPEHTEAVAAVAQSFLGTRILCARCHNHPQEKYTQDDYYHFAGFFARVRLERKPYYEGVSRLTNVADPMPVGVTQPGTGRFLAPRPLDRSPVSVAPGDDPRAALADWITSPTNEYFSGAMVNRLVRHFLGVGLVEPVDDLRTSNPPANPALWRALTADFVRSGFDLRHTMRLILKSRTYQLSSATSAANERDTRFYSRYYVRRLPAEVLLDAICQSTGVAEEFPGYPVGIRAQQLADPAVDSSFLKLFGRPLRLSACACERADDVTLAQLLHLVGGDTLVKKIKAEQGRLARLLRTESSNEKIIAELFRATLSRPPSREEMARVQGVIAAAGEQRDAALRDLFWALLNSKDFSFNH